MSNLAQLHGISLRGFNLVALKVASEGAQSPRVRCLAAFEEWVRCEWAGHDWVGSEARNW